MRELAPEEMPKEPTQEESDRYAERQYHWFKNIGMGVGDMVDVICEAVSYQNGWPNAWEPGMNRSIGKRHKITSISEYGVRLDPNDWHFPYFCLEPASRKFKEGQKVRFIAGREVDTRGHFVKGMDIRAKARSRLSVVREVRPTTVRLEDGYHYPKQCLVIMSDSVDKYYEGPEDISYIGLDLEAPVYTELSQILLGTIHSTSNVLWASNETIPGYVPEAHTECLSLNFYKKGRLTHGDKKCFAEATYVPPEEFLRRCKAISPKPEPAKPVSPFKRAYDAFSKVSIDEIMTIGNPTGFGFQVTKTGLSPKEPPEPKKCPHPERLGVWDCKGEGYTLRWHNGMYLLQNTRTKLTSRHHNWSPESYSVDGETVRTGDWKQIETAPQKAVAGKRLLRPKKTYPFKTPVDPYGLG